MAKKKNYALMIEVTAVVLAILYFMLKGETEQSQDSIENGTQTEEVQE